MDETATEGPEEAVPEKRWRRIRGYLTGDVQRWELVPFVLAIIAIVASGFIIVNAYADTRARDLTELADTRQEDLEAEVQENRSILATLVDAICEEVDELDARREARLRALVEALVEDSSPEARENVLAVLDSTALPRDKCLAAVTLAIDLADEAPPATTP